MWICYTKLASYLAGFLPFVKTFIVRAKLSGEILSKNILWNYFRRQMRLGIYKSFTRTLHANYSGISLPAERSIAEFSGG